MRFVRLNGKLQVDFFHDKDFAELWGVLDAEMKRLKSAGIGSQKRQAEPLTPEEEERLWEKGILGDHSPQALLNAVFYFNGIYFALRSGDEHRRLRYKDSQIQVFERHGERSYLLYVEDVSKKTTRVDWKDARTGPRRWLTTRTKRTPHDARLGYSSCITASVQVIGQTMPSTYSHWRSQKIAAGFQPNRLVTIHLTT